MQFQDWAAFLIPMPADAEKFAGEMVLTFRLLNYFGKPLFKA